MKYLAAFTIVACLVLAGCGNMQGDLSKEKSPSAEQAQTSTKKSDKTSKPGMPNIPLVPVGSSDSVQKVGESDSAK